MRLASARAIVSRRPGRAAVAGLVVLVALVLSDVLRGRVLFERKIAALYWRCARRPSARRALEWAAVTTMQVLAGSPEIVLLTGGIEAQMLARHMRGRDRASPALRRLLGYAVLAAGLSVGLTAVQWVPAVPLVAASRRSDLDPGTRAFWSLRPIGLTQWLVPLFPRDLPLRPEVRQYLYQGREPFLGSRYLGLAAPPLAQPALRADAAFRAVALPVGEHTVDLAYRPLSVCVGAALSLASAAAFLPVAWAFGRRAPPEFARGPS